ncbi:MAG: tetratricopeptide repeat protein [Abditibacteriota bacterium]|nr:tetratricopeptide repeat protein [Abditibacteriota bacterium]
MKRLFIILVLAALAVASYGDVDPQQIQQKAAEDPAAAIADCQAALAEDPGSINARKWLAYLCYNTGKYQEALDAASVESPTDPTLPNYAGLSCVALGRYQDAVRYFDTAIILDKDWYEPYNNKGIAYDALGNYPAAKNAFLSAYNLQAKEADMAKKSVEVYINYARSLANLQDYKGALKIYGYAEKLSPDNPEIMYHKADTMFRQGDYAGSIDAYKKINAKKADDPRALKGIANCYLMQNKTAEALGYYDKALAAAPDYESSFNAGLACRKAGQFGNAVKYFTTAIQLKADDVDALNELGWAEFKSGSNDNAIAHIKAALDLKPDYMPAMLNMASLYSGLNDGENAYAAWSLIVMREPANAAYRINLGNECHNTGRYTEAVEQFQEAIRLDPKVKGAYYGLGTSCIALAVNNNNNTASLNRALEAFAKALELDPDNSNIYANQAVAYQYLGKYPEAIAANEKALKLNPSNAVAAKNLENLKKTN